MSNVTPLSSGTINGQSLKIELVEPGNDLPNAVVVHWPAKPTVTSPAAFDKVVADAMKGLVECGRRTGRAQGLAEAVNDGGGMTRMPDLAGLLAGAATELDRFDSDPGPLLTVQDGVDAKVQESAEYRGITCDQRGVLCLDDREATAAVDPVEKLQEIIALSR